MAEAFTIDPESLADAVQRMAEFQRYVEGMLDEVDTMVSTLHTTWTGEGATAHAEAHRHWARGAAMMREALTQLHGAGKNAHANYTGAMAANTAMWT